MGGLFSRHDYKQAYLRHDCEIEQEEDIINAYYKGQTRWQRFQRNFRNVCLVCERNLLARAFLKSKAAIKREKIRHLTSYSFMIHPFSKMRQWWETLMALVLVVLLIYLPICITVPRKHFLVFRLSKLLFDIVCVTNIFVSYFTGFYDYDSNQTILHPKTVACHYFKTLFIFDFLASFPFDICIPPTDTMTRDIIPRLVMVLKLLHLYSLTKFLTSVRSIYQLSAYSYKLFSIVYSSILMLLWTVAIYLLREIVNQPERVRSYTQYIEYSYKTLILLFAISPEVKETLGIFLELSFMTAGVVLRILILTQIVQLLNKYSSSNAKYQQVQQQLHRFMKYKELPDHIRNRIQQYHDYKFQKSFYKENEILSIISGQLKQDIVLHSCRKLVEKVVFLKDLPSNLIVRIVTSMKSEVYLPNDVIIQAGSAGEAMYFISTGTVAVYTSQGAEVTHLEDGANFGEVALVMENEKRIASVIAIEPCEVFILTREDFRNAIAPYPDLYERMKKIALTRLQKTMAVMNTGDTTKK